MSSWPMVAFERFIQSFLWSSATLLSAELMLMRHEAITLRSLDLVLDDRAGGIADAHDERFATCLGVPIEYFDVACHRPQRDDAIFAWCLAGVGTSHAGSRRHRRT